MASITITASACSGNNHLTIQVSGDLTRTYHAEISDVRRAGGPEELREMILMLIRNEVQGLTPAQTRAKLQTGITVTTA